MDEDYDLVQEFDNIVEGLRKKALVCLCVGYFIGVVVGGVIATVV